MQQAGDPIKEHTHSQLRADLFIFIIYKIVHYEHKDPKLFRLVALCPKVLLSGRVRARRPSQILGLLQPALPEPRSERS